MSTAAGAQEAQGLLDAGFTPVEVADWQANQTKSMLEAGFSRAEVDTHFGTPPFTIDPITEYFHQNIQRTIHAAAEPKPVTSFMEAIEAGLQISVAGLTARGQKPSRILTSDADWMDRMVANTTTLAADLPVMGVGALIGGAGGPTTAMAGSFALPAGVRRILMDKYELGEVKDFGDFWTRLSGAVIDTAKNWVTGAATAKVGQLVGLAPIVSPTAKSAAVIGSELTTMVTVGRALEGDIPSAQDFVDTALVLGFVKMSMHGAQAADRGIKKLRGIYAETGVRPDHLARDLTKDVTIQQDVLSSNIETPKAYKKGQATAPVEWEPDKPMAGGAPVKKPPVAGSLEDATAKIEAKISVGAKAPKEKLTFQKLYTAVIDDLNPIREAVKDAAKESVTTPGTGTLKTADDPYQIARLTRGTFGKADVFLEHQTYDYKTYQATGKALKQILDPVKNELREFRIYTAAKRALELNTRGIDAGLDLEAAKTVVKTQAAKYDPIMRELVEYQNRVSKYLLDAGVVSRETYDKMLLANKDYVPFFRVMDDGGLGGPWLGGGLSTKNPIKGIKGSEKVIIDPLESVIKNTYTYIALAERNAVGQKFVEMANKSGRPEDYIQKVKPDLRATTLTEPEIERIFNEFLTIRKETTKTSTSQSTTTGGSGEKIEPMSKQAKMVEDRVREALLARGFQKGEADQMIDRVVTAKSGKEGATVETIIKEIETTTFVPELNIRLPNDVATVFRAVKTPLAENEIAVFEKGKRVVYEVDPEVAKAFKAADQETANLLMKILHVPATALRGGAVLSPEFIARNALRDQLSAFVFSQHGYLPGLDFVNGLISLGKKDESFVRWLHGVGANSALVSMDRQYLQEHLFKLSQDTGLMSRAINVAKSPLEILRITSELVENATRLGEFKRVLKGSAAKEDIQHAAFESREVTLDFARIGAKARAINMISAFFNAQVQGVDRMARAIHEEPISTLTKLGVSVTLPSVLLWWANHDDQRYKDLQQWEKDLFWIILTKEHIYRIPKPFEAGLIFGSIPERVLDKYVSENPDAMRGITQALLDAMLPNPVPTFAAPMVEQFSNKSLFTGNPVIPSRMEKLMPEYQYTEYTTELTKTIGALIGAFPGMTTTAVDEQNRGTFIGGVARALTTPILIDNYIRSWTGGLGQHVVNAVDKGLREAGVLPDPVLPARTLADIPFVKAFVVRYPAASTESIQRFYDDYYTKEKVHNTFIAGAKSGDPAMMERAMTFDQTAIGNRAAAIRDVLTQQGSVIRGIYKNPTIPPEEKRQLIDQTYFTMIQLAQEGNRILNAGPQEAPQ